MNKNFYYHAESVELAIGTAGLNKMQIALPDSFNKIIGFGIAITDDGGDPNFKVGLRKNSNELLNVTHNVVTRISADVAPKDKFLPFIDIVEVGNKLFVVFEFNVVLTSKFKIDVIFKTINPNDCNNSAYPTAEGDQGRLHEAVDLQNPPH